MLKFFLQLFLKSFLVILLKNIENIYFNYSSFSLTKSLIIYLLKIFTFINLAFVYNCEKIILFLYFFKQDAILIVSSKVFVAQDIMIK